MERSCLLRVSGINRDSRSKKPTSRSVQSLSLGDGISRCRAPPPRRRPMLFLTRSMKGSSGSWTYSIVGDPPEQLDIATERRLLQMANFSEFSSMPVTNILFKNPPSDRMHLFSTRSSSSKVAHPQFCSAWHAALHFSASSNGSRLMSLAIGKTLPALQIGRYSSVGL